MQEAIIYYNIFLWLKYNIIIRYAKKYTYLSILLFNNCALKC